MKKIFTLMLAIFAMVVTVNAKNKVTTLWEETYSNSIILNPTTVGTFESGDILRIYLTLTEASNVGISYKSESNGWTDKAIPSVGNMWPWISSTGDIYYDVTFTDADITALSGQNIYITKGANSTPTKIELIHPCVPSSTTNISTDEFEDDNSWTGKAYDAIDAAKIGDVIKFTYTATGTWLQMYIMNHAKGENWQNDAYSITNGETYTYEYEIPDYATLKKIRTEGFAIKGACFKVTSVDLLTYSDSYGYTTFTIGEAGLATWSSDKKYDFASAGLTAYYASSVTTGKVTMTPKDITWDWQGYIIKGDAGSYDVLESLTTDGTYYPSTNYLKPNTNESSVTASTDGKYHYIFAKHNSDIGFYKLTADHTLAAHKAYLETSTDITPVAGARGVTLDFGDGTTAILKVLQDNVSQNAAREDGKYYTLQGVCVETPTKGLYIRNGKKILVK